MQNEKEKWQGFIDTKTTRKDRKENTLSKMWIMVRRIQFMFGVW